MMSKEKTKEADPPKPKEPFWKSSTRYSRSQRIAYCNECQDTSFEMLDKQVPTKQCCRCGEFFK